MSELRPLRHTKIPGWPGSAWGSGGTNEHRPPDAGKNQPYSLQDMLADDESVDQFVGRQIFSDLGGLTAWKSGWLLDPRDRDGPVAGLLALGGYGGRELLRLPVID